MRNHADDLAAIRRLMEDTQQAVLDRGGHLILWGLLTACGLVLTWLAAQQRWAVDLNLAWFGLIACGWVGSLVIGRRQAARAGARTTGQRLLAMIWIGSGVALSLIGGAGMLGGVVTVDALPGLIATVMGVGFFGTSALSGMAGARYLAVAWWGGGAVMLFRPGLYTLLLLASMALVLQVLPGVVMQARTRGSAVS